MTTIPDLIKGFIDTSKERLKTPISGAFIWAFMVWNWRPIILLLFSDASIEDKIVVINNEYCSFWALFFPLCLAFFYILIVPKIMVEIDKALATTNELRVENIYTSKIHDTKEKQKLALEERKLKDIENGNKQIDELQTRFDLLEESKNQIIKSHEATINQLNEQLEKSNNLYYNNDLSLSRIRNRKKDKEKLQEVIENFTQQEKDEIKLVINKKGVVDTHTDESIISKLYVNELISNLNGNFVLTERGEEFMNLI